MMRDGFVHLTISRWDPAEEKGMHRVEYRVPVSGATSLLRLLEWVYRVLDPSLAFRSHDCHYGTCNVCIVKMNGKRVRACATIISPGERLQLSVAREDTLIRDLVFGFPAREISRGVRRT